jgi:hypothetical protein
MSLTFAALARRVSELFSWPRHGLLPAAAASLIGAIVFTYYSQPSAPASAAVVGMPAGADMMQMVRDEHALIVGYVTSSNELRQQADLGAEQDMLRAKAAERAELAALETRQTELRSAAASAHATEQLKRKVAAQAAPERDVAGMPLQLASMASTAAPFQPAAQPPTLLTAHVEDGPIRSRLRRATAAVRRIPYWAHSVAAWITDAVPSRPQLPDLHNLRASI